MYRIIQEFKLLLSGLVKKWYIFFSKFSFVETLSYWIVQYVQLLYVFLYPHFGSDIEIFHMAQIVGLREQLHEIEYIYSVERKGKGKNDNIDSWWSGNNNLQKVTLVKCLSIKYFFYVVIVIWMNGFAFRE